MTWRVSQSGLTRGRPRRRRCRTILISAILLYDIRHSIDSPQCSPYFPRAYRFERLCCRILPSNILSIGGTSYTEGFEQSDLKAAKRLLDELEYIPSN